jgi:hypothetical protein
MVFFVDCLTGIPEKLNSIGVSFLAKEIGASTVPFPYNLNCYSLQRYLNSFSK